MNRKELEAELESLLLKKARLRKLTKREELILAYMRWHTRLGVHALCGWLLNMLCDGEGAALAPPFSDLRPIGALINLTDAPGCGPWHHAGKGKPAGEEGREGEEEACPFTGAGGSSVASVVRLNSGGSSTMERMGLSLEQAKEEAARMWEAGEPPGCAWCVRLEEKEEEEASERPLPLGP